MTTRKELTHTDGVMNPAPEYAHRLLDLVWGGWGIMPSGGLRMWQASVPGEVYGARSEYGKVTFGVDFREDKKGVWTVSVDQPQPRPVPPEEMSVDEWLRKQASDG